MYGRRGGRDLVLGGRAHGAGNVAPAGDAGERNFAKTFPTITVDGCAKRCSQVTTEKLSGKPRYAVVISELLKDRGIEVPSSKRNLTAKDQAAIDLVAEDIAKKVDEILRKG